jgi:hypothetical protein
MSRILGPFLFACWLAGSIPAGAEEPAATSRNVGYRRTTLVFKIPSGKESEQQLGLWYLAGENE